MFEGNGKVLLHTRNDLLQNLRCVARLEALVVDHDVRGDDGQASADRGGVQVVDLTNMLQLKDMCPHGVQVDVLPSLVRALTGAPASELGGEAVELDALHPGLAAELYGRVAAVPVGDREAVAAAVLARHATSGREVQPDAAAAWAHLLTRRNHPVGLVLTRQNVPVFPRGEVDGETWGSVEGVAPTSSGSPSPFWRC